MFLSINVLEQVPIHTENYKIAPLSFTHKRINTFNMENKAVRIQEADTGDYLCGFRVEKVFLN